jgi:2-keto-3-deoxy-L-rhamnonate aldolase RhmA
VGKKLFITTRQVVFMRENPLRQKLRACELVCGTMIKGVHNPLLVPLLADTGLDFAIVDTEHSAYSYLDVQNFALAARTRNIALLVRPPGSDYHSIAKVLDCGAEGILVPRVETPEEVAGIIAAAKYPPIGKRGYSPSGVTTGFKKDLTMAQKVQQINQEVLILLQIEKSEAVNQIEAIIQPPEIDGVIIGPADLSLSVGVPGDYDNPKLMEAITRVITACRARKIPYGIHLPDVVKLSEWKQQGMTILMYANPFQMIAADTQRFLDAIRGSSSPSPKKKK